MKRRGSQLRGWGASTSSLHVLGAVALCTAVSFAAPPIQMVPPPIYSFDLNSPSVTGGQVMADDAIAVHDPFPVTAITGTALGLGAPGDELDALSSGNVAIFPSTSFVLLFSVSRDTAGAADPDLGLVFANLPYNVRDQAARAQQAGDEFMSTLLFTLVQPQNSDGNNVLVRNNYDEGGSDLAARPPTSANSVVVNQAQDNVDALADMTVLSGAYFSASAASPSLLTLPGSVSGANLYHYDLNETTLYASFGQLGLVQSDEVDALIVFDYNQDGIFDGADRVLFSLTPGSPSLSTISGASAQGAAADVFQVRPNQGPTLFASAASLGLGAPTDNVDALDLLPCGDAHACALLHGIRMIPGDFDNDGDVDQADSDTFNSCFQGEGRSYNLGCEPGDFDHDADIDCGDWVGFAGAWTAPGWANVPTQCRETIPAVSDWGLIIAALLMLTGGTLLIRSSQRDHAAG